MNTPEAVGVPLIVTTLADHTPVTPAGKPVTVAPVATAVEYVIGVIAVLIHTVCALVPAADVNVAPQAAMVVVHKPRPWVPAAMVPSELLYFSISVLTIGKVEFAVHTVDPPLRSVVSQTPVSVAIYAFVLSPGTNMHQCTGISGRFPSTAVQPVPPFVDIQTFCMP